MKYTLVALVSFLLLTVGCAHKQIAQTDGVVTVVPATTENAEDQAIKKLPGPSTSADLPANGSVISQIPVEVNPEV